jgi:NAD(P)-dependent dehydrogenase (short-subunit alcohol dehydrogenase family)
MSKILITGCSSGFGLETAKLFLERGWDVVATMRTPNAELLPTSDRLQVLALDVTDPDSVTKAVAEASVVHQHVDGPGFGAPSPIELTEPELARALFSTNTLGTLAMVQAVLPAFRASSST